MQGADPCEGLRKSENTLGQRLEVGHINKQFSVLLIDCMGCEDSLKNSDFALVVEFIGIRQAHEGQGSVPDSPSAVVLLLQENLKSIAIFMKERQVQLHSFGTFLVSAEEVAHMGSEQSLHFRCGYLFHGIGLVPLGR